MKKLLMICNSSQNIYTFRLPLIKKLECSGYQVETISFDNKYGDALSQEKIKNHCINNDNRSINPFKILDLEKKIHERILEIKPDIVLTFMAKPNIFGVMAAHKANVKFIFSTVEGAGDPFINTGIKWKLIKRIECILYKKAFKYSQKVFFVNEDDKREFETLKLISKKQALVVNGIGVDLAKFSYRPVDTNSNSFIMVARMLKTKGTIEYCKCAEIVKQTIPEASFLYLGGEGSIRISDIQEYIDKGYINYIGNVFDVRPYIESSLMMLLPSYREGKPMSIMEAEAMGRGVITTNNIGCRDTVIDGYNGFLVDHLNYQQMANQCIKVLSDKTIAENLGKNARLFAEQNFDQKKINEFILEAINENSSCAILE